MTAAAASRPRPCCIRLARRIMHAGTRLRRDMSGVMVMEFALSLPLLVGAGLYGVETINYASTYLRINALTQLVADNAARVRASIDEQDVKEVFAAAKVSGETLDFANRGRVILSDVEPYTVVNSAGAITVNSQWLRWQRCYGANAANSTYGAEGDGGPNKSVNIVGYGPTSQRIIAAADTSVMMVEVSYTYRPIISSSFITTAQTTIRATAASLVRQRANLPSGDTVVTNGSALGTAARPLCSNAHTG